MNVRYRVTLTQSERDELEMLLSGGKHPARKLKRAQILLAADAGVSDEDIAVSIGVGGSTVYRTKRRFVEGNLDLVLSEEPRPGAERKLTGKEEALLVATACSSPPAGRARWTLELLADALVELTAHESLSRETVRRRLAENNLKPWRKDMWCIPQVDADYVARMEDVLDLYAEATDPKRPVVCFDESPIQLIGEARQPIPAKPGQIERYDCEYRRNGTANLFVFLDVNRPAAAMFTWGMEHEFVIVGWSEPEGTRPYLGALLLGYYTDDGKLIYAGRVGTGMPDKVLGHLRRRREPLSRAKSPLDVPPPRKTRFGSPLVLSRVHWVEPKLVAEITYLTWTADGLLRHTVYVGLREDKPAEQVRREA